MLQLASLLAMATAVAVALAASSGDGSEGDWADSTHLMQTALTLGGLEDPTALASKQLLPKFPTAFAASSSSESGLNLIAVNKTALEQFSTVLSRPYINPDHLAAVSTITPRFRNQSEPLGPDEAIFCYSHHKTGTAFCEGFFEKRSALTGETICRGDVHDCTAPGSGDLAFYERGVVTPKSSNFRMIHFIREPHKLITSGYRYNLEYAEKWSLLPNTCLSGVRDATMESGSVKIPFSEYTYQPLDAAECKSIFSLCDTSCAYQELARSLNETNGVVVEAENEWYNIDEMMETTVRYANDPHVLQLSIGSLAADFNGTMACINRFLASDGLPSEDLHVFDSLADTEGSQHSTSGMYDNSGLYEFLTSQPVWGGEFTAVSDFMQALFRREADAYGCPMP